MSTDASNDGHTVVITVGPEELTFHVKKDVLVKESEYFARALNGPWMEARTRAFNMPEEDAEVFGDFAAWLKDGLRYIRAPGRTAMAEQALIRCYLFGERRGCTGFRNQVLTWLCNIWRHTLPGLDCIELVYEVSLDGSKIRKLMADVYAWRASRDVLEKIEQDKEDHYHPDFTGLVFKAWFKRSFDAPIHSTVRRMLPPCRGSSNGAHRRLVDGTLCFACNKQIRTRTSKHILPDEDAPFDKHFAETYHD